MTGWVLTDGTEYIIIIAVSGAKERLYDSEQGDETDLCDEEAVQKPSHPPQSGGTGVCGA